MNGLSSDLYVLEFRLGATPSHRQQHSIAQWYERINPMYMEMAFVSTEDLGVCKRDGSCCDYGCESSARTRRNPRS